MSPTLYGTLGYIPAEGYQTPPQLTSQYDYVALARIIAEIWGVELKPYVDTDYVQAKEDADRIKYEGQIPEDLVPVETNRKKIENILTALSEKRLRIY